MLACLACGARVAGAEEVPLLVGGRPAGTVYVYRVGRQRYLDVRQAIAAYGGHFEWRPVSGSVQLSVRGRPLQLKVDSQHVRVPEGAFDLPEKVIVRAGTVLVPTQFFVAPVFEELAWAKTRFDDAPPRIEIQSRSSVGPLRWFSYQNHTRLVLELDPRHPYSVERRGSSGMDVLIPLGTIEAEESQKPGDGIVDAITLRQEPRLARLSIHFSAAAPSAAWEASLFSGPQRLVVDVYRDRGALKRGRTKVGASIPRRGYGERASEAPPFPANPRVAGPPVGRTQATQPQAAVAPSAGAASAPARFPAGLAVAAAQRLSKRRIVIDPGHGGRDSGATGPGGVREKDINLLAAKELAKRLTEHGAFEVMLTRERDVFVPLADRSRMANDFSADLFVSLHCNANRHRGEKGFEIYFLSEQASDPEAERVAEMENAALALEGGAAPPDAEAAVLLHALARTEFINDASAAAGMMSKELARQTSMPDRGVKQAAFYVLRGTEAPAILVEMGFVSNPAEESKLQSRAFRHKIVEGVVGGVLDFAERQDWVLPGGAVASGRGADAQEPARR